ncbi:hypothetical protein V3C99_012875, partial [Haemonchus contortus]
IAGMVKESGEDPTQGDERKKKKKRRRRNRRALSRDTTSQETTEADEKEKVTRSRSISQETTEADEKEKKSGSAEFIQEPPRKKLKAKVSASRESAESDEKDKKSRASQESLSKESAEADNKDTKPRGSRESAEVDKKEKKSPDSKEPAEKIKQEKKPSRPKDSVETGKKEKMPRLLQALVPKKTVDKDKKDKKSRLLKVVGPKESAESDKKEKKSRGSRESAETDRKEQKPRRLKGSAKIDRRERKPSLSKKSAKVAKKLQPATASRDSRESPKREKKEKRTSLSKESAEAAKKEQSTSTSKESRESAKKQKKGKQMSLSKESAKAAKRTQSVTPSISRDSRESAKREKKKKKPLLSKESAETAKKEQSVTASKGSTETEKEGKRRLSQESAEVDKNEAQSIPSRESAKIDKMEKKLSLSQEIEPSTIESKTTIATTPLLKSIPSGQDIVLNLKKVDSKILIPAPVIHKLCGVVYHEIKIPPHRRKTPSEEYSSKEDYKVAKPKIEENEKVKHDKPEESLKPLFAMMLVGGLVIVALHFFFMSFYGRMPAPQILRNVTLCRETRRMRLQVMTENIDCSLMIKELSMRRVQDEHLVLYAVACLSTMAPYSVSNASSISALFHYYQHREQRARSYIDGFLRKKCTKKSCSKQNMISYMDGLIESSSGSMSNKMRTFLNASPIDMNEFRRHWLRVDHSGPASSHSQSDERVFEMPTKIRTFLKKIPKGMEERAENIAKQRGFDSLHQMLNSTRIKLRKSDISEIYNSFFKAQRPLSKGGATQHMLVLAFPTIRGGEEKLLVYIPYRKNQTTSSIFSAFVVYTTYCVMYELDSRSESTLYDVMLRSQRLAYALFTESREWNGNRSRNSLLNRATLEKAARLLYDKVEHQLTYRVRREKPDRISSILYWHFANGSDFFTMLDLGS